MSRRENEYQAYLIEKIKSEFPDCVVLKNDSSYIQGFPDLTILCGSKWAILEVKRSARERSQPNQEWYIDKLNSMSYAAFIFPENEEEVFDELQQALKPSRVTRLSKR